MAQPKKLPKPTRLPVHIFDGETAFCEICGSSKLDYEHGRICTTAQNIVGISHLIARKLKRDLEELSQKTEEDRNET